MCLVAVGITVFVVLQWYLPNNMNITQSPWIVTSTVNPTIRNRVGKYTSISLGIL
jgi:predicted membrane chloride channel (bestrophin family)